MTLLEFPLRWRPPELLWLVANPPSLEPPTDPAVSEPMDDMSDRSSAAARAAVAPPKKTASVAPVSNPFESPMDVAAANAAVAPPTAAPVPVLDDWIEAPAGVLWLFEYPGRLSLSVWDVPLAVTRSAIASFCGGREASGCSIAGFSVEGFPLQLILCPPFNDVSFRLWFVIAVVVSAAVFGGIDLVDGDGTLVPTSEL